MPYLTPQDLPEDDECRPLSIPASSEWLALFGGALTELTMTWNWQYSGGLTVDETVDKMKEIVSAWYTVACAACTVPGGYLVARINPSGHMEVLDENGDWAEPTGEYFIPSPEAREGGTDADQKCLAAKNAVNVLNILYESLSDSWSEELSTDEAIVAFIAALVAAVGFAFAPIVWAAVTPILFVFGLVYEALAYLTADIWDEDYTDKLVCAFLACATNDAGVVTFDWDCLQIKLQGLAEEGGFNEIQARLNLQIAYILSFIGGIDALNLAARTTDITDDDCSGCDLNWCYNAVFDDTTDPWTLVEGTFDAMPGLLGELVAPTVHRAQVSFDFATGDYTLDELVVSVYASGINPELVWQSPSGAYVVYHPATGDQSVTITELLNEGFGVYKLSYAVTSGATRIYGVHTAGAGETPMPPDNC